MLSTTSTIGIGNTYLYRKDWKLPIRYSSLSLLAKSRNDSRNENKSFVGTNSQGSMRILCPDETTWKANHWCTGRHYHRGRLNMLNSVVIRLPTQPRPRRACILSTSRDTCLKVDVDVLSCNPLYWVYHIPSC